VILWRISNHAALDGGGGLRAPGRWHSRGRRIVYCAPNPATALLEVLVHAEIDAEDVPITLRFLEIEAPDSVTVETADTRSLGSDWRRDPEMTRPLGDLWLHSGRTALLQVPSAVVPATWNVLINPQHPDSARIRVVRIHKQPIDRRLPRKR
jgi:RES domain-containing protein